jgi:hypothetical protein
MHKRARQLLNVNKIIYHWERGRTLGQIAHACGVHKKSIWRPLQKLIAEGKTTRRKMPDKATDYTDDSIFAVFDANPPSGKDHIPDPDKNWEPRKLDFEPTEHPAGSPEKRAVIAWRAANGYPLWHPKDNPEVVKSEAEEGWTVPCFKVVI